MPSKSLTFLKWLLAALFVLDAAAIGVVLVIIYLFYPGNIQSFFRLSVAIAQAPTAVPVCMDLYRHTFPPQAAYCNRFSIPHRHTDKYCCPNRYPHSDTDQHAIQHLHHGTNRNLYPCSNADSNGNSGD
jgi:hypothetical protein